MKHCHSKKDVPLEWYILLRLAVMKLLECGVAMGKTRTLSIAWHDMYEECNI
jgi:hypothetical protein